MKIDSIKILVAGCALIALGAALLFVRPDAEGLAVSLITGGVGLLAPGALRIGSKAS